VSSRNIQPDEGDPVNTSAGLTALLLQSEIKFWREMIRSLDASRLGTAAHERMQQALALAEFRLAEWTRTKNHGQVPEFSAINPVKPH